MVFWPKNSPVVSFGPPGSHFSISEGRFESHLCDFFVMKYVMPCVVNSKLWYERKKYINALVCIFFYEKFNQFPRSFGDEIWSCTSLTRKKATLIAPFFFFRCRHLIVATFCCKWIACQEQLFALSQARGEDLNCVASAETWTPSPTSDEEKRNP